MKLYCRTKMDKKTAKLFENRFWVLGVCTYFLLAWISSPHAKANQLQLNSSPPVENISIDCPETHLQTHLKAEDYKRGLLLNLISQYLRLYPKSVDHILPDYCKILYTNLPIAEKMLGVCLSRMVFSMDLHKCQKYIETELKIKKDPAKK